VVVIPSTSGASSLAKAVASVFAPCVPPVFSVLLVIGGSLVPGGGTVVLADAILTPTLEPSLLSSQIQQRPGHPPSWHAEELGRLVEPALNFVEVQRRAHDKEPRMTRGETASRWMLVAGLTVALTASSGRGYAEAAEPTPGAWTGGAALGFLGNTDDRTAFAMNLNVERFLNRSFSVGPLLQFGVTGNLTQIGVSGQVKYWLNLSKALKLTAQGGLGFMHTDVPGSGTSLLVPLGVGFDYALNRNVSATATFLLNFTDINTSVTSPHVMPGLTFGLRF